MVPENDGREIYVKVLLIVGLPEEVDHQLIVAFLQHIDHCVVDLILVLRQPVGDVVVDDAGVVRQGKVGVLVLRARLLLQEGRRLPEKILFQLVFKGLVGCLGEQSLLLEDGHQTHRFLHALDGGLQVHAEVHHLPFDALPVQSQRSYNIEKLTSWCSPDILLLFENKHVVVEELLQLLVTEIDAYLLEGVEFEDLKT